MRDSKSERKEAVAVDIRPYSPPSARLAGAGAGAGTVAGAIVDGIDERESGAKMSCPGRRAARLFCEMKWAASATGWAWLAMLALARPILRVRLTGLPLLYRLHRVKVGENSIKIKSSK